MQKVLINGTLPASVSKEGIRFLADIFDKIEQVDEIKIEVGLIVFWPFENENGYIKAFVSSGHLDKFEKNGASLSLETMKPIEEDPFDGMSGKQIAAYVEEKTGEEISYMGSTASVKKRALECLKQHDK